MVLTKLLEIGTQLYMYVCFLFDGLLPRLYSVNVRGICRCSARVERVGGTTGQYGLILSCSKHLLTFIIIVLLMSLWCNGESLEPESATVNVPEKIWFIFVVSSYISIMFTVKLCGVTRCCLTLFHRALLYTEWCVEYELKSSFCIFIFL